MSDLDTMSTDVLVVGGGPAGAAAAIELARSGRSVAVVDKAVFPRDKCCGDGLTTLALRELEQLEFDPGTVTDWQTVDGAVLRSPSGRTVHVPLPDDGMYAAVAPRLQFDDALLRTARKAGASIHDGRSFRALRHGSDHVLVDVDGARIATRYVVAADGMWSPVRKACGLSVPGYLGEWHGVRQYVHGVSGPAGDAIHVWFEPDLLPGYAWSFPLPGGRVNLGFGVRRYGTRQGAQISAIWRDLPTRPHIAEALGPDAEPEERHLAWPIPARIDRVPLAAGRVLFVGDAAAATDVMTGEGIGQALLTGRLAAESIIGAGALQPSYAADLYRREVAHHLFADHRMAAALGQVLSRPWGARGAVRVVGASGDWGRSRFGRWMFEDEPRAVLLTPGRWHRELLARRGAYRTGV